MINYILYIIYYILYIVYCISYIIYDIVLCIYMYTLFWVVLLRVCTTNHRMNVSKAGDCQAWFLLFRSHLWRARRRVEQSLGSLAGDGMIRCVFHVEGSLAVVNHGTSSSKTSNINIHKPNEARKCQEWVLNDFENHSPKKTNGWSGSSTALPGTAFLLIPLPSSGKSCAGTAEMWLSCNATTGWGNTDCNRHGGQRFMLTKEFWWRSWLVLVGVLWTLCWAANSRCNSL